MNINFHLSFIHIINQSYFYELSRPAHLISFSVELESEELQCARITVVRLHSENKRDI